MGVPYSLYCCLKSRVLALEAGDATYTAGSGLNLIANEFSADYPEIKAATVDGQPIAPSSVASAGAISGTTVKVPDSPTGYFYAGTTNDLKIYHDGNNSYIQNLTGDLIFYNDSTTDVTRFFTGAAECMTLIGNGNVLIGTTTDTGEKLQVSGNTRLDGSLGVKTSPVSSYGIFVTEPATDGVGIRCQAVGIAGSPIGIYATAIGIGATQNAAGIFEASGATTNINVVLGAMVAGGNNWSLYSAALAKSYIEGSLGLGTASASEKLDVIGNIKASGTVRVGLFTVATLPAGAVGTTSFVTDATLGFAAGIGLAVVGGGANEVPVFYGNGSWRIG